MTVSIEEIYILIEDQDVSVFIEDAHGVGVDVDETTVSVVSEDFTVVVSPQETTLLVSEVGVQGPAGEEDVPFDLEVDDTSTPNNTYIGQAEPGTAVSAAAWRIKRVTESAGGTSINWANGDATFTHIWDDRLTYTYGP